MKRTISIRTLFDKGTRYLKKLRYDERKRTRAILFSLYMLLLLAVIIYLLTSVIFAPHRKRVLYFYDIRDDALMRETQKIPKRHEDKEKIRVCIEALRDGPLSLDARRLIPYETKLKSVFISDDTVILDFDEHFFLDVEAGMEALMIESLTKTIFKNFRFVDKIRIIINGQTISYFAENVDLRFPIMRASLRKRMEKELKEKAQTSSNPHTKRSAPAKGDAPSQIDPHAEEKARKIMGKENAQTVFDGEE